MIVIQADACHPVLVVIEIAAELGGLENLIDGFDRHIELQHLTASPPQAHRAAQRHPIKHSDRLRNSGRSRCSRRRVGVFGIEREAIVAQRKQCSTAVDLQRRGGMQQALRVRHQDIGVELLAERQQRVRSHAGVDLPGAKGAVQSIVQRNCAVDLSVSPTDDQSRTTLRGPRSEGALETEAGQISSDQQMTLDGRQQEMVPRYQRPQSMPHQRLQASRHGLDIHFLDEAIDDLQLEDIAVGDPLRRHDDAHQHITMPRVGLLERAGERKDLVTRDAPVLIRLQQLLRFVGQRCKTVRHHDVTHLHGHGECMGALLLG